MWAFDCKEPRKGTAKDSPVWKTDVIRLAATQRHQYTQQEEANIQLSQQEQIIRSYSAVLQPQSPRDGTTRRSRHEIAQKITTEVTQQINTQKQQIEQVESGSSEWAQIITGQYHYLHSNH